MLIDSKRGGTQKLGADTNVEENNNATLGDASQNIVEFLDDGFKLTTTNAGTNVSGGTYVYAAFGDRAGNNFTANNLIASAGLETASRGMDVVTYTGNGSTQSITGLNFQPDFVWLKGRSQSNVSHQLYDVVRGTSKMLQSDNSTAEGTVSGVTSFDSNGFTIGSNGGSNNNTSTYVAWAWKAGGTAVSNTDGTITSSVSANQTYGFSICNFVGNATSGASFGHGLGAAPKWVIIKSRDSGHDWIVYHASVGDTGALRLNNNSTVDTNSKWFNNTSPSSSVFTLGHTGGTNDNGDNMLAYCWSEIPGFSRFASYSGNGSSTGPVVTTGFKPRYILIKADIAGEDWVILDTARDTGNPVDQIFFANTSDAELTNGAYSVEFKADGFQIKNTNPRFNTNGSTYYYAAFADKPPGEIIDSLIDTPTNYEADSGNNGGNYCTWNPLHANYATLSNGNLAAALTGGGGNENVRGTIAASSGLWYWEETLTATSNTAGCYGVVSASAGSNIRLDATAGTNAVLYMAWNGSKAVNGTNSTYGASYTVNDVIGVALDLDGGTITFYKNNVSQGAINLPATGIAYTPTFTFEAGSGNAATSTNFGQRGSFVYTPPTGYKSLHNQPCRPNDCQGFDGDGCGALYRQRNFSNN